MGNFMKTVFEFLYHVRWLIRKEFLVTLKDPASKKILVIPVILQGLLFGYVATFNLNNADYALYDQSHSQASQQFISHLDGSGVFNRVRTISSSNQIADCIDSGDALFVLVIDSNFEKDLASGGTGKVQIISDGRNSTTAGTAVAYIGRIVENMNYERSPGLKAVELQEVVWFNPNLQTRWSFLPGMMAMISLIQVMILAGLSVARERENGTFDQLLVTPYSNIEIMIGKAIPPLVIGLIQSTIILLFCRLWFSIPMAGSLLLTYLVLFAFCLSCSGIGLTISAISNSMQQVMVYCFVLLIPEILLSGLLSPVANMPDALQTVTLVNPLRYALEGLKRVYLEGIGLDLVMGYVGPMLLIAVVTLSTAAWMFRNKLE